MSEMSVVYLPRNRAPVAVREREWAIPRPPGAKVDEQKLAQLVAALQEKDEVVLSGVAGSGKTTLIRWLTPTYLIAPTAKAAQRIAQSCSMLEDEVPDEHRKRREGHTVHSAVYSQPIDLWFADGQAEPCKGFVENGIRKPAPCKGCTCRLEMQWPGKEITLKAGTILVVDEASMVDAEMAGNIRQRVLELGRKVPGLKILWSGDPAQLPPVKSAPGVDLQRPDVMLETVHRTEKPGILDLSAKVRQAESVDDLEVLLQGVARGDFPGVRLGERGWEGAGAWRIDTSGDPDSRMLITWTNADRVRLNQLVRQSLRRATDIQRGDRILVRSNNYMAGLINSQILGVTGTEPDEKSKTVRIRAQEPGDSKVYQFIILPDLLETADRDAFRRESVHRSPPWSDPIVNVQYGYVLTCHAAQGSQARDVGVMWTSANAWVARKNFADARAWLYTAITRAEQSVTIWRVNR